MPYIKGKKLSQSLDKFPLNEQKKIMGQIGESIAKLHKNEIIHGDLTTSNMILLKDNVYFIDFGLGYISRKIEDKAVDLHLLKQALEAKHFNHWKELFEEILKIYEKTLGPSEAKKVFERIKSIEKRGRYRH
jgi:Kae1-associated kinase Bud32